MSSELFVLGTSHAVAPSGVRERLHVEADQLHGTLARLTGERGVLLEAAPLVTCARLEVYGVADDAARGLGVLARLGARRMGVGRQDLEPHVFALRGEAAVRHILRVASGLDSVVCGETQVLGQVRQASRDDRGVAARGPILNALFDAAIATGKRVRTETGIGKGTASLATAALAVAREELGSFSDLRAVVIGAGETGRLVAKLLAGERVASLTVANRTVERAREVAHGLGAASASLDDIDELIAGADLVVGASRTERRLITVDHVRAALDKGTAEESRSPMLFLDLGHPRNVAAELADLPGVRLVDLDAVFARVREVRVSRSRQLPLAEAIVEDHARRFVHWMRSRDNADVIRAIRDEVLTTAYREADRLGAGRTEADRETMRALARSIARSVLHAPTVALRNADPGEPEGSAILRNAAVLFGVDGSPSGSRESA